jgi:sulfide:quinone oxidoreductase
MTRTLVLGAGFGGLSAATELARLLPRGHEVTLVDEREEFVMGLAKLHILDGRATRAQRARSIRGVERHGVRFVRGRVEAIDHDARRVRVSGEAMPYDHLVLAMGARLAPVPEGAHSLYTLEGVEALHRELARRETGDALVAVTSMPFKCPAAPYEAAMLIKAFRPQMRVTVASPEPHPIPSGGAACGATISEWIEERGVVRLNGTPLDAALARPRDVTAIVPAHLPPEALGEWIAADAATLATKWRDTWAIGDCTVVKLANGKPLTKAGVLAEGEGLVVAQNIAARVRGEPERARFDGKGGCYLELGHGEAVEIKGDFYAKPEPIVAAGAPSKATLEGKRRFEEERLARWFDEPA